MKSVKKQIISRKLVRLAIDLRCISDQLREAGLYSKANETAGAAAMAQEWAECLAREASCGCDCGCSEQKTENAIDENARREV
jgi:hypothetical protein